MRLNPSRDESKSTYKQNQHHDRAEEAYWPKIDMQVRDDSGKDEKRAGDGKNPPGNASAFPKQKANTEKHGQQTNPKSVLAMESPVRTHNRNLVDQ